MKVEDGNNEAGGNHGDYCVAMRDRSYTYFFAGLPERICKTP